MEFGLREALLALGSVAIVGILIDGFRRKLSRKSPKKAETGAAAEAEFDLFAGELPGGAARSTGVKAEAPREEFQLSLGGAEGVSKARRVAKKESVADVQEPAQVAEEELTLADTAVSVADAEDDDDEGVASKPAPASNELCQFDEVIVINVMAKPRDDFSGNDLLRALLSVGLRHGDMNIFHRHEQITGKGAVLFSAVNIVEPGTFDLNRMEEFKTPGICMFMRLPGPKRSLHAFEQLVDSARKISNMLGADLKDENHSVLTTQTVEHYRQRVLDFERKLLSQRGQR